MVRPVPLKLGRAVRAHGRARTRLDPRLNFENRKSFFLRLWTVEACGYWPARLRLVGLEIEIDCEPRSEGPKGLTEGFGGLTITVSKG